MYTLAIYIAPFPSPNRGYLPPSQQQPSQNYGPPNQGGGGGGGGSGGGFGGQQRPSSQYGPPQQGGGGGRPSSTYGPPSTPSSQYGPPSPPSSTYGAPSAGGGFGKSIHGLNFWLEIRLFSRLTVLGYQWTDRTVKFLTWGITNIFGVCRGKWCWCLPRWIELYSPSFR